MKTAEKIIELAESCIGRKESNGSHKYIIDVYNSHKPLARGYRMKYTDAWCCCFVSFLAIKLGYTDIIPTEVGCGKYIDLFKQKGIWIENENRTPNPGDIIFYDWEDNGIGDNKGNANHVGIVASVTNGNIRVIEGNINDSVGTRTIKVNGRYIRGYATPKYDKATNVSKPVTTDITKLAKDVIAGKYGNGEDRKKALGSLYTEVQKEVNRLLSNNVSEKVHIVKSGETLSSIAKTYKSTITKIYTTNKSVIDKENKSRGVAISKKWIYPGQKLVIK